jgi:hypothetical protein
MKKPPGLKPLMQVRPVSFFVIHHIEWSTEN